MVKAIKHKGIAIIDILQGCPTYNDKYTSSPWFSQHLAPLPKDYDPLVHNPDNQEEVIQKKMQAIKILLEETQESMHTGIFFQWENPDTFETRLLNRGLKPPIDQMICDKDGRSTSDITNIIESLKV